MTDCSLCGGSGYVTLGDADDGRGHWTEDEACERCHGSGEELAEFDGGNDPYARIPAEVRAIQARMTELRMLLLGRVR